MKAQLLKKNIVGVKELRQNLDKYIARVKKGDVLTVFRRSEPVFKISPVTEEEDRWETVVDLTEIRKGGIPAKEVEDLLTKLIEDE